MPTYTLCKLRPKSPFHFGERGVGLEETTVFLHSDTLFSAICHGWRMLYGAESLMWDLLDWFIERMEPFLLSSAFPYAGDVLFFPKPFMQQPVDSEAAKEFKRVLFVSEAVFQSIIAGEDISQLIKEDNLIHGGRVCVKPEEKEFLPTSDDYTFWKQSERTRVTVDRISSASEIYHFGEVTFAQDCGLYFLIDFNTRGEDNSFKSHLQSVLRFMGDEGFGGDRSSGCGLFDIKTFADFSLPNKPDAERFMTLSCYCPSNTEELTATLSENTSYELTTRSGWIYSPDITNLRRRTVSMFSEGSILNVTEFPVGHLVDVTPQNVRCPHKVYRYGYAFPIGL